VLVIVEALLVVVQLKFDKQVVVVVVFVDHQ
jgi:hypothetical protein